MRTTLREIARHARVHYSTASHVLNGARGSTRVSDETRGRILAAAAELGYTANRAAQQLRTRRSNVVGLLVGALENPFFARMVSLCEEALEAEGFEIVLAMRRKDELNDLHLLEALASRQLAGFLIWNETVTELWERVRRPDMDCTVVLGYDIPGRDSVGASLETGISAAVGHLADQGRCRVGYFAPRMTIAREGDPRHDLYRQSVRRLGQAPRVVEFDGSAFDVRAARERADRLADEPDRPDALLCHNDMAALGAMSGLRRRGLRVPEDVALVGCDDLPLSAELDVPLTSIEYPLEQMCRTAVARLRERISARAAGTEPPPIQRVLAPTALHVRASSLGRPAGAREREIEA